jgi:hypothetical protein
MGFRETRVNGKKQTLGMLTLKELKEMVVAEKNIQSLGKPDLKHAPGSGRSRNMKR